MKKASNVEDDFRYQLAKGFLTVFTANMMCISYRSAEKYVSGDFSNLWFIMADVVIKTWQKSSDDPMKEFLSETKMITESEN